MTSVTLDMVYITVDKGKNPGGATEESCASAVRSSVYSEGSDVHGLESAGAH